MKFASFQSGTEVCMGVVEGETIKEIKGDIFGMWAYTGQTFQASQVKLKAPLMPRHIIGIGKNFLDPGQAKQPVPEMPIFFYKPLSTVIGPEEAIRIPQGTEKVKFESELAAIIGKPAKNIGESEVRDYIFGYTVANDVAAVNYFHPDGHWTIGKAFDTFCPLGPYIETDLDYNAVRVKARVNGETKQDSGMDEIIMPIDKMIAYISRFMTLMPGDVILTGTPAGAGMVVNGDVIECVIDEIGTLRNPVQASK
jgi:2-keto-4-pentenoate hydratase/2-oxohepta-3-ene-1,7-dioic acid hydratase in catechol pathway